MRKWISFSCLVAVSALLVACGDSKQESASQTTGDSSPVAIDAAAAPTPAMLAAACLAGDPAQGEVHSVEGAAQPLLALVTIESLATRDSARLAARLTRAVDVLPSDTSRADFHGLPVSVRAAWILVPSADDSLIIALAARRMPIESDPLEELFFVVSAPGDERGVHGALIESWVARDVGAEDELAIRELAGAWLAGDVLSLALVHEAEGGPVVEVMERRAGKWSRAWSGALPSCAGR